MLNNEEPELNFNQKKRLEEMRKNKSMIENWLSILSDEERCIIQLHLIDGKSWKGLKRNMNKSVVMIHGVHISILSRLRLILLPRTMQMSEIG